jgi:AraC family transcriptional regulator, transcriptional activator FtrA
MPHRVAILAYDRLCTFEFGCAVELFALERPELGVPWYSHVVCAVEDGPLRAAGGLTIQARHGLEALAEADTIVIPGWRDLAEAPPPALAAALRAAHLRGARICSICSGAFVLGHAGLLDGRKATTHWRYTEQLAARWPLAEVLPGVLYVEDRGIITSAGSAAGLDMLMHLVRSDYGSEIANLVARRLVLPAHRGGEQTQLVSRPMPSADASSIAELMDWVREHLRAPHSVESMAQQARMSRRSFQRRFKETTGLAPLDWLVRERVALAADLLESRPTLLIDLVAELAGFGSSESLRRHFRRLGRPSPARLRRAQLRLHED